MTGLIRTLAIRIWIELITAVRWHGWRHLPIITRRLGPEGALIALELCEGEAACNILRQGSARIGKDVRLCRGLTVHNGQVGFSNLAVGDQCHIGRQVFLDLADQIVIGNRVTISMRTVLLTHTDAGSSLSDAIPTSSKGRVVLNDDCYLGAGVTVLAGVTIGRGAVVGAGAVVTKDIPDNAVVAGIPARDII